MERYKKALINLIKREDIEITNFAITNNIIHIIYKENKNEVKVCKEL